MGWAGAVAKIMLIWLILRTAYWTLMTQDERDALMDVAVTNVRRAYYWLKTRQPTPPHVHRVESGGVPSLLVSYFFDFIYAVL